MSNYETKGTVDTITLSDDEKMEGVEYVVSGYIIIATSFTIAKKTKRVMFFEYIFRM